MYRLHSVARAANSVAFSSIGASDGLCVACPIIVDARGPIRHVTSNKEGIMNRRAFLACVGAGGALLSSVGIAAAVTGPIVQAPASAGLFRSCVTIDSAVLNSCIISVDGRDHTFYAPSVVRPINMGVG